MTARGTVWLSPARSPWPSLVVGKSGRRPQPVRQRLPCGTRRCFRRTTVSSAAVATVVSAIPGAPPGHAAVGALVALGSTAMFGQPEWLVTLLLCGVVPLTLLAAYPVVRGV